MNETDQPDDLIRYDVLTQNALRTVIKKVLEEVSVSGLPGEHHFFITFHTDHPGVRLSARMRERYKDEMTIVIQHSFWDLKVTETAFEIDLSFDDILERLRVPFSSLKGFFDPHVKFGVQFDAETIELANDDFVEGEDESTTEANPNTPAATLKTNHADNSDIPEPEGGGNEGNTETAEDNRQSESEDDNVVSLDHFRKKH